MTDVRIKICGITRLADAILCRDLRVDYIGLIFAPQSPRRIATDDARKLVAELRSLSAAPGTVLPQLVGVFKDQPLCEVNEIAAELALNMVQLHGAESADYCSQLNRPVMKAIEIPPGDGSVIIDAIATYRDVVRVFLFDRPKVQSTDMGWLKKTVATVAELRATLPDFVFAGGLTPANVAEVVSQVSPFAVDVASGVEKSPGVKDADLVREFVDATRGGAVYA